MGALVTGILATKEVNSNLKDDLLATLFRSQLLAIAVTLVLSTCATAVIALILKAVMGLRLSPEEESAGLDLSDHGEEGISSDSVQLLKRERRYEEDRSDHQAFQG